MSKVSITKSKLDSLATAIAAKTSATAPMTIAQMETAVSNIPAPPSGTITITQNQTGLDVSEYALADVAVPTSTAILQYKSVSFTPSETAQSQTVSADSGYDGLDEVTVSVGAISSYYVGSDITRRYSTDLTASGATITAPSGYYGSNASLTVPSGTAGTPTATKGTVSNHAVYVTPSVTNTTGYITGSTKTGTAVSVSASELVSGTLTISSSGTKDVTNYASASVAAGSATAPSTISGTSATVSTGTNTLTLTKSVSVTPTVTAGYVSSGTAGNASVSLTASVTTQAAQTIYPSASDQSIASGRYLTGAQTIKGVTTTNLTADNIKSGVVVQVGDSSDSDRILSVTGTYSGGSSGKNVQVEHGTKRIAATAYTDVGYEITVAKTGTYNVYWAGWRSSTSGTNGAQLYVNGTASGSAVTSFDATWTNVQNGSRTSVSLTKDDKVTLRARSRGTSYYMYIFYLSIEEV